VLDIIMYRWVDRFDDGGCGDGDVCDLRFPTLQYRMSLSIN